MFDDARRRERMDRRNRDWQLVIVAVSVIGTFVFEMFHEPPCDLASAGCSGTEFAAQIGVNAIWALVIGVATSVALAASMGLIVDSLDARRSTGSAAPMVRALLGIGAVVIVFVVVLVRFQYVRP